MIITIDNIYPDIAADLAEIETRFKTESEGRWSGMRSMLEGVWL